MENLIRITEHDGKQAVSARELHAFLEIGTRFDNWIKRMFEYGFVENTDYVKFECPNLDADYQWDYALTLNCSKEISMIQRTEKGKQARQYFIACEEKLKEVVKQLTPAEMFLQNAQLMVEHDRRLEAIEQKVKIIEAKSITRQDFFAIAGYATLKGMRVSLPLAGSLGRKAAKLCKERGIEMGKIKDPRFGEVNTYPEDVLEEVFGQPIN